MEKADNATPLGHTATQTDLNKMLVAHFHLLKTFENNKKIHEGKAPDQEKKKKEKEKEKKKSGNSTIQGGDEYLATVFLNLKLPSFAAIWQMRSD
jgi:hypothetical protein